MLAPAALLPFLFLLFVTGDETFIANMGLNSSEKPSICHCRNTSTANAMKECKGMAMSFSFQMCNPCNLAIEGKGSKEFSLLQSGFRTSRFSAVWAVGQGSVPVPVPSMSTPDVRDTLGARALGNESNTSSTEKKAGTEEVAKKADNNQTEKKADKKEAQEKADNQESEKAVDEEKSQEISPMSDDIMGNWTLKEFMEMEPSFLSLRKSGLARVVVSALWIGLGLVFYLQPGTLSSQVVFASIAALLICGPPMSYLTEDMLFYGTWDMFKGYSYDNSPIAAGTLCWVLGLFSLMMFAFSGAFQPLKQLQDQSAALPILAIIRVLLPVTVFFGSKSEVHDLMEAGFGRFPVFGIIQGIACFLLCVGVHAQGACLTLVVHTTMCMGSKNCHHHHTAARTLLLGVLAFTPCSERLSLKSVVPPVSVSKITTWPTATALFRLHMGILYFAAGVDKLRNSWIQGYTLQQAFLHYGDGTSFRSLFVWVFPRTEEQLIICAIMTWSCIMIELCLPFMFWTQFQIHAVFVGFIMHFVMSLTLGGLGGFTQVSWLGLLGCLDSGWIADKLQKDIAVAKASFGLLVAMMLVHCC